MLVRLDMASHIGRVKMDNMMNFLNKYDSMVYGIRSEILEKTATENHIWKHPTG